ncbi:MAG TPA: ABC transporter permease [Clostridia bacterium]|nr:ABC transporter permease [Clostridia bacterium]
MLKYILKRFFNGLIVLLGVITITFFIARVIPSDPAAKWVGARATAEQKAAAVIELGLDKPLYVQYFVYLGDLLQGDLGRSLNSKQQITTELATYFPATFELVLIAFVFAVIIGIPLGIYSAKKNGKLLDHISRFFSIGAVSLPTFWVGLILQLVFYRMLGWLPLGGRISVQASIFNEIPNITGLLLVDCVLKGQWSLFLDALAHIVLPAITISLYPIGLVARMTRSALLEILNEDYIVASRSYGVHEGRVLWGYALKNSLGATATVVALSMGYTLVNTFLTETIFSWPGLGSYVGKSVVTLDFPAIVGISLVSAIFYVVLNLLADIIIAMDPRVRL